MMTDPFRYRPDHLVLEAGRKTIAAIASSPELENEFRKGKMIGVLVCKDGNSPDGTCVLAAFSGNIGGRNVIEGFVPPIYDLLDPEGKFKKGEEELDMINRRIESIFNSTEYINLVNKLEEVEKEIHSDLHSVRLAMAESKRIRDAVRSETDDPQTLERLIRESQHEKAELKRRKEGWDKKKHMIQSEIESYTGQIEELKRIRAEKSDELQKWIFRQYIVHNAVGECRSISEIFSEEGMVAPGGTGECAAPKLLEYAYRNGMEPIAMGEFWYGKESQTAVRVHGHFYPSCTSKCGPLLRFMMKGLDCKTEDKDTGKPSIIHMDESVLIVSKPSGIPSVKGLNGKRSLEEELKAFGAIPVHRLDMDTSGIMVFARNESSAVYLKRQFEEHTVRKTYVARLVPDDDNGQYRYGTNLHAGNHGEICLPLAPDYDERPRQKVDKSQGRHALTSYRVISENPDGSIDIEFHPHTGRTHQLRVHSAHPEGLGRPIMGDMLYGGCCNLFHDEIESSRLHLHARSITFRHPESRKEISFQSDLHMFA